MILSQEAWMELRAFRALADPGGARAQVGRRFDDRTGRHLGPPYRDDRHSAKPTSVVHPRNGAGLATHPTSFPESRR
jgi:hypothetical protein